jgi:hypothetical protein
MESHFGHDFSRVRVHTGQRAADSARQVNALAYTVANHIVFNNGRYTPGTSPGARLLAHELSHVVQQSKADSNQDQLSVGAPNDAYEEEAHKAADLVLNNQPARVEHYVTKSVERSLQRDLATPPPAVAPAAQPDLTEDQIRAAIAFNRARYNEANTRLIQELLGGPVTGTWSEENIVAIAATQEEYNLEKDGKVGNETFRFLNREARLEGLSTSTKACLTSFRVIGPNAPTLVRVDASHCRMQGSFGTQSQFSARCNCSQFQYRQFIRGTFTQNRGGVITDRSDFFGRLPSGSLTAAFQEDGDNTAAVVHYGHRDEAAEAAPINRYTDNTGAVDQADGCRYENDDFPGGTFDDCLAGDSFDINMNFRGEIQRNGTPIQSKFWTAIRATNWRP